MKKLKIKAYYKRLIALGAMLVLFIVLTSPVMAAPKTAPEFSGADSHRIAVVEESRLSFEHFEGTRKGVHQITKPVKDVMSKFGYAWSD